MSGPRLQGLQGLRALAALLVVFVHSVPAHFAAPAPTARVYWQDFGSCGVDIFFVISGFIVSLAAARAGSERAGARHFLVRRAMRIYPLYWIATSIVLAGGLWFHQVDGIHQIWWMPTLLLLPTFRYPANPPLLYLGWTLLFEMYFYLVLAMFLAMRARSVIRCTVLFLCAMAAAGATFGMHRPLLVIWMNPLLLEFVFGCLIGWWFVRCRCASFPSTGRTVALAGGVLLLATLLAGPHAAVQLSSVFAGQGCWQRVALWGIPAAFLVGGVIFWAPAMDTKAGRLLVFLGDASYSIYLCTIPSLWLARQVWNAPGKTTPGAGMLADAVWATSVGVVCYQMLERPITNFLHSLQTRAPVRLIAQMR